MDTFRRLFDALFGRGSGPAVRPAALTSVYRHGLRFFVPTLAVTADGIYLETEPVEVVESRDARALAAAIEAARARGHAVIPTPPQGGYPEPAVVRRAGAGSWRAFETRARLWSIEWTADGCTLTPSRRARDGGFEPATDASEVFRGADATPRAAARIVGEV